jgi:cytochrome c556
MSSLARAVTFGTALLAVIALMAGDDSRRAYGKPGGNAQKDILDLADMLANGKNIGARAAALKKKYEDLEQIMNSYKPGNKGGIGYGKKKEGIELKLIAMGKEALAAGALKKEKDDLLKMAYINLAIAEVASHYAPAKPKAGKGAAQWKKYTSDQKKAVAELVKAINASSPAKVKAAANDINSACNGCHADFRD